MNLVVSILMVTSSMAGVTQSFTASPVVRDRGLVERTRKFTPPCQANAGWSARHYGGR